jgi:hypothetical protein
MHGRLIGHSDPIFSYEDDFFKIQHLILLREQVVVFNSMCWRRSGLFVISGEPCAGKCTLATKLAIHYAARCKKVLCLGSTPAAANDIYINACIRTALMLPTLVCFRTSSLSPSDSRFMRIVAADVIHACPMISCHMLDQIFYHLIQI